MALLCILPSACSIPYDRGQSAGDTGDDSKRRFHARTLTPLVADVAPDSDPDVGTRDLFFERGFDDGSGYGIDLGMSQDYWSVSAVYLTAESDAETARSAKARTHGGFLMADILHDFELGPFRLRPYAGVGFGGASLDFRSGVDRDTGGGALIGRVGVELGVLDTAAIGLQLGAFQFGYPGEWIGSVQFATVSAGISVNF